MSNALAHPFQKLSVVFFILTIHFVAVAAPLPQEKMTAEQVLAKHLASIGPADALAAAKSIIAVGECKSWTRQSSIRELPGITQLASAGDKVLLAMLFEATYYPFEKMGYDGQKQTSSILPDGKRSFLITFLMSHDAIFKQGLIGGTLSTAWPLLKTGAEMPKLSYAGTDKINGRPVHRLKYDERKSGGMQVILSFDAETFRHVRTEYRFTISARLGAADTEVRQSDSRYQMMEDFSDFKKEGNLMLPHIYKISYTLEEPRNTQVLSWTTNFSRFVFNEEIDPKAFIVTSGS